MKWFGGKRKKRLMAKQEELLRQIERNRELNQHVLILAEKVRASIYDEESWFECVEKQPNQKKNSDKGTDGTRSFTSPAFDHHAA
ncbi:hypothetical protein [Desulfatirhabdium butyrativorans]|uniref:hypothetical protein n=1 Tax=Desulfatirhabdium butyrativorans TaxID=340467 RepID=UPI0003FA296B|nr:hypothetical protein [Desulfatirhabdium butyrativorans]